MTRLDQHPDVRRLAKTLTRTDTDSPVDAIVQHCLTKVRNGIPDLNTISHIGELQERLCSHFRLVLEEIWNEEDLSRLIRKYIARQELVFASVPEQLKPPTTFGILLERRRVKADSPDRYVAIVDCRGDKAAKRFFTRWHEIAHLLTLDRQLELPLFRTISEAKCPLESVMDIVAAKTGFYAPLFVPILEAELSALGRLSFEGVERVRTAYAKEASFDSTLLACIEHTPHPLIYVEAGLGLKRSEERRLADNQLTFLPSARPSQKLRVLRAVPNPLARNIGWCITPNMRIPESSIIFEKFENKLLPEALQDTYGEENLTSWVYSNGSSLKSIAVRILARRRSQRVIALIDRM